jgi:hypothetical protein
VDEYSSLEDVGYVRRSVPNQQEFIMHQLDTLQVREGLAGALCTRVNTVASRAAAAGRAQPDDHHPTCLPAASCVCGRTAWHTHTQDGELDSYFHSGSLQYGGGTGGAGRGNSPLSCSGSSSASLSSPGMSSCARLSQGDLLQQEQQAVASQEPQLGVHVARPSAGAAPATGDAAWDSGPAGITFAGGCVCGWVGVLLASHCSLLLLLCSSPSLPAAAC